MSETGAPVIHISGTVSEKDYTSAVRWRGVRGFLRGSIFMLLTWILIVVGLSLYYWYPVLRDGHATCAEWLDETWKDVFRLFPEGTLILGFLAFQALLFIIIRPFQAKKRLHELNPGGFPIAYDFFDDHMVIAVATQTSDETVRLKYTDVQRKIKEDKYIIRLSTGQRNRIGLYKAAMAPEEVGQVRELLKERCPQRKIRK